MTLDKIAIRALDKEKIKYAKMLAHKLKLPYVDMSKFQDDKNAYDHYLVLTKDYLGLQRLRDRKPFHIDFLHSPLNYRALHANFRNEAIARAIGVKPNQHPYIVDATAGFGRDSFILATLGFHITMLEREPIVYVLLAEGLKNAQARSKSSVFNRITLIHTDATEWLSQHKDDQPLMDVIYMDPMFPKRQKSASVKKESLILQELQTMSSNDGELFKIAFTCAKKRVVIKRPKLSAYLANQKPDFSLTGNQCRFDIYLV